MLHESLFICYFSKTAKVFWKAVSSLALTPNAAFLQGLEQI